MRKMAVAIESDVKYACGLEDCVCMMESQEVLATREVSSIKMDSG